MLKKDLMNVDAFFILSEISRTASKRKASESLSISIDTINKYVEDLEREMGVTLLVTNSRGCSLTPFAQKIVANTKGILKIIEDTYASVPRFGEMSGEVNVCMTTSVVPNLRPCNVGEFVDQYPNVCVNNTIINNFNEFSNFDYDIGMCFDTVPDNNMVLLHRVPIRLKLFASPEYLMNYGYPRDIADLQHSH